VVRFAADDTEATVQLLQEDKPCQLVSEGHGGERKPVGTSIPHFIGKAKLPPNEKGDGMGAGDLPLFQFSGELAAGPTLSFRVKGNNLAIRGECPEEFPTFCFLYGSHLRGSCSAGGMVLNLNDFDRGIGAKPDKVFLNSLVEITLPYLSHSKDE